MSNNTNTGGDQQLASSSSRQQQQEENKQLKTLLVIRHGERIDFTFDGSHDSWVSRCFNERGHYRRTNINMPRSLPLRSDGHQSFALDTPLTEMGYLQAKITGRALREAGCVPSVIYVSPALRCVQTAVGLLKGMGNTQLQLNIEPALFEWAAWFRAAMPSWMSPTELADIGYPINRAYRPMLTTLKSTESLEGYYDRSYAIAKRLLDETHRSMEHGSVALVAHGASLDTCTRQLTGASPRTQAEFYDVLHSTPYLAIAACRQTWSSKSSGGARASWEMVEPPILPFRHQSNNAYDWKMLLD